MMVQKTSTSAKPHDGGNGYLVRPDLQTKLVAGLVLFLMTALLGWVGFTLNSATSRLDKLEAIVETRATAVDRRLDRIERLLERLIEKETNK